MPLLSAPVLFLPPSLFSRSSCRWRLWLVSRWPLAPLRWTASTSTSSLPPLAQNLIFRFLQTRQRVEVWLYAATDIRMRGFIVGFDEYMNVVLDEAVEVSVKRKTYVWIDERLLAAGTSHLAVAAGPPAPGLGVDGQWGAGA